MGAFLMFFSFNVYSLTPPPALIETAGNLVASTSVSTNKALVAKGCSEVKRWYAWTRCGTVTCCKLFIACSDGTIVTQTADATRCK